MKRKSDKLIVALAGVAAAGAATNVAADHEEWFVDDCDGEYEFTYCGENELELEIDLRCDGVGTKCVFIEANAYEGPEWELRANADYCFDFEGEFEFDEDFGNLEEGSRMSSNKMEVKWTDVMRGNGKGDELDTIEIDFKNTGVACVNE